MLKANFSQEKFVKMAEYCMRRHANMRIIVQDIRNLSESTDIYGLPIGIIVDKTCKCKT